MLGGDSFRHLNSTFVMPVFPFKETSQNSLSTFNVKDTKLPGGGLSQKQTYYLDLFICTLAWTNWALISASEVPVVSSLYCKLRFFFLRNLQGQNTLYIHGTLS